MVSMITFNAANLTDKLITASPAQLSEREAMVLAQLRRDYGGVTLSPTSLKVVR